jgi:hypothetical protein
MPRPGIIRRPASSVKVTDPTLSTATTRTGRCHSRNQREQPIRVPVVPAPMNSTSSRGNWRAIAGAVVR